MRSAGVLRICLGFFLLLPCESVLAQSSPARPQARPAAQALFERDWVLMNWALKHFDLDGDILLQPGEAQAAAETFRRMADTNHDGRVTPQEYARARQEILERE